MHNQLGIKKYTELYDYMCLTHNPNKECDYTLGKNQEYLFTNKLL